MVKPAYWVSVSGGDTYLRTLLIDGARSVMRHSKAAQGWLHNLQARRPFNVATVGL